MSDYPDGMILRPIDTWPGEHTRNRQRSRFEASWASTLELLRREVAELRKPGTPVVLQIAMREEDFRIDGLPRARAVASHPGVILSIESKHGALSYPCDRFDKWQDNIRAVALGLEALRLLDRYGITKQGNQYRGWRAIESTAAPTFATAWAAENWLRGVFGETSDEPLRKVVRRAKAATHPDNPQRAKGEFPSKVDDAVQLLEREGRL